VKAAPFPRPCPGEERLLHLDARSGRVDHTRLETLPSLLRPGDVLVVNDAATLPASLSGTARGEPIELRLAAAAEGGTWWAVLFGAGDWRLRTEDRPAPPRAQVGEVLRFGPLAARVEATSPLSPRLLLVRFDREGDALWAALYRIGRPVQYSYLGGDLSLEQVQTAFAGRPWAVEMPSAGRALPVSLLLGLARRGVALARLTHAAGLSATGDPALDEALPLPERYALPAETVRTIDEARGRVVAVGTTVVRALEGNAAAHGRLVPGEGVTGLRLGPGSTLRVVGGLLTGLHEPGSSHHRLLTAFCPLPALEAAWRDAEGRGYLAHEFGDTALILAA
jgi:S-adenosylmethionine:tRNA ribosyltransferase-isomerase